MTNKVYTSLIISREMRDKVKGVVNYINSNAPAGISCSSQDLYRASIDDWIRQKRYIQFYNIQDDGVVEDWPKPDLRGKG